jgi:spermidine dehydrogenase
MTISRRDFLNGVALSVAAGLSPAAQLAAQPRRYPPALTGMRGHHAGAFETAHALALEGRRFDAADVPAEEHHDLIVVGGGISGLAAACFYRKARPHARVLVLDNHDDFGGHAKRNEFAHDGRLLIGYGGSESIQSPRALWSTTAMGLLRELAVDVARFEQAFDRRLYPSLGLAKGIFFAREAFGRDVLAVGDPSGLSGDDEAARDREKPMPMAQFVAQFPISEESKRQLLALYDSARDPLAGVPAEEKIRLLRRTSYRDYLTKICGCSREVADCFQGRTLGFYGLGADSVPAAEARALGYPGFAGLGLPHEDHGYGEPYIYHFPDGNASLARLLVRSLVPRAASGRTMEDVVLARFDYGALDRPDQEVRIRLDSTCVDVRNTGAGVSVAYVRGDRLHRVEAEHAILACFHMMIPHLMPELPAEQRAALAQNVKTPLVYTNVLIRDWRAWQRLGVHDIAAPMSFHSRVKLDFPVSLGGYRHPRDPAEPILVHMVHVPGAPNQGLDARAQFRAGRAQLLAMTFADFEDRIRDELDRMLGPGGFSSARDIAAITVNRWSHGYSYVANSLFDSDDYDQRVLALARRPFGRVAIANTDAGGDAWAHYAIDQAARAVGELLRI